ncbi:hypothetical protein AWQ21_07225 [Picosynechococcus sp. PCC 7003]|nr:hypothetical protein AWQ21_07225 [Picosynechococcus sp. PCC 7003]
MHRPLAAKAGLFFGQKRINAKLSIIGIKARCSDIIDCPPGFKLIKKMTNIPEISPVVLFQILLAIS